MAGAGQGNPPTENVVLVAVKAEREISKTPLAWALAHVVRPGDFVTLLAVIGNHKEQRRWLWSFPKFNSDCSSGRRGASPEDRRKCDVSASCSQMALQFHGFQDQSEVNMRIKVVVSGEAAAAGGAVAAESKRLGANWIVLDRQLKQEAKGCMEELPHCNVVLMKRSHAKVLRLNLGGAAPLHMPHQPLPNFTHAVPPTAAAGVAEPPAERQLREAEEEAKLRQHRIKHSTPTSSTEEDDSMVSFLREYRASTSSSSTTTAGSSSPFVCEHNPLYEGLRSVVLRSKRGGVAEGLSPPTAASPWLRFYPTGGDSTSSGDVKRRHQSSFDPSYWSPAPNSHNGRQAYWAPNDQIYISSPVAHSIPEEPSLPLAAAKTLHEAFTESDQFFGERRIGYEHADRGRELMYQSDGRDAASLLRSPPPPVPPPLCSICRHKAPVFGKPPRWFSLGELEEATGGFSEANFVSEGGFGWVHRGLLPDGRVVAVKTLKTLAGPKANDEFRAEVEVLSRAQHRNVVLLLGFCVEGPRRVLVYEYVCNGSLAVHLHGRNMPPLDWPARLRIAVGSARGLRYLHEDCRVGFIHRDVRPNNILLTHDFEPLVGDFGLARWQIQGNGVDTRVIGTFGYLAPEYIESGVITEKADVYAFGVVLLELITGRRAMDMGRTKGQQFLTEWARPVLALAAEGGSAAAVDRLLDPRLDNDQTRRFAQELNAMAVAASLCLRREPHSRPSMSKVLRVLEGETVADPGFREHPKEGRGGGRFGNPMAGRYGGGPKGSLSQRIPQEAAAKALVAEKIRAEMY